MDKETINKCQAEIQAILEKYEVGLRVNQVIEFYPVTKPVEEVK